MGSATHLTPEQRRLRARIGALALHAQGGTNTRPATDAFLVRFEREVLEAAAARGQDLTPDEVGRRVRSARKAYYSRLALASSRARAQKKAAAGRVPQVPEAGGDAAG